MKKNDFVPPRWQYTSASNDTAIEALPTSPPHYDQNTQYDKTTINEQQSRPSTKSFLHAWHLELLSAFIIIISLLSILLILATHSNKPLPHWSLGLTVNALISTFGVLFKACLMLIIAECLAHFKFHHFASAARPLRHIERFDAATRGPLGAAKLLRAAVSFWREGFVPMVGALVVLLSVGVDPFLQQLVHYGDCMVPLSSDSSGGGYATMQVPRANWLVGNGAGALPVDMIQRNVYRGFLGAGDVAPPISGSWDTSMPGLASVRSDAYWNFGFCYRTDNLTASLTQECQPPGSMNCSATLFAGSENALSLSSSEYIATAIDYAALPEGSADIANTTVLNVLAIANLSLPASSQSFFSSEPQQGILAGRFSMYPCAQQLYMGSWDGHKVVSFQEDRLTEIINASVPLVHNDADLQTHNVMPTACLTPGDEVVLAEANFTAAPGAPYLSSTPPCSAPGFLDAHAQLADVCYRCYYSMNDSFIAPLRALWDGSASSILDFNANASFNSAPAPVPPASLAPMYTNLKAPGSSPEESLTALASSLSATFRTVASDNFNATGWHAQENVSGTSKQTCTLVRWEWMTLPFLMAIAAFALLGYVFWKSRRVAFQSWKSSTLAVLFHGLEREGLERLGRPLEKNQMEKVADETYVRLLEGNDGELALRAADKDESIPFAQDDLKDDGGSVMMVCGVPATRDVAGSDKHLLRNAADDER